MNNFNYKEKKIIYMVLCCFLLNFKSGFSSEEVIFQEETQKTMKSLGYPPEWSPLKYQIGKLKSPKKRFYQDFVKMREHTQTTMRGIVEYYTIFFSQGDMPHKLQLKSSEATFSIGVDESHHPVKTSFEDSLKTLMKSTKEFIETRYGSLLSETIKNKLPAGSKTELEVAENKRKTGIRDRVYNIWYTLMFLHSFERDVRSIIKAFPKRDWKNERETLVSCRKEIQTSADSVTAEDSAEEKSYKATIKLLNKDIEEIDSSLEKGRQDIAQLYEKYSNILQCDTYWGYLVSFVKPHPCIVLDRNFTQPRIKSKDVQNAYLLMEAGLGLKVKKVDAAAGKESEAEDDMEETSLQYPNNSLEAIVFGQVNA